MNVCLLSLSFPYITSIRTGTFSGLFTTSKKQVIEEIRVGLEELVGLLQALPSYQARKAKDNVVRCWEARVLARGHHSSGGQLCLVWFLFSSLPVSLDGANMGCSGHLQWCYRRKMYNVGLEQITFQICSVILLFCRLGHCFPYKYALLKKCLMHHGKWDK